VTGVEGPWVAVAVARDFEQCRHGSSAAAFPAERKAGVYIEIVEMLAAAAVRTALDGAG